MPPLAVTVVVEPNVIVDEASEPDTAAWFALDTVFPLPELVTLTLLALVLESTTTAVLLKSPTAREDVVRTQTVPPLLMPVTEEP